MRRRIRLVVAYDGTDFCGWQRQHNGPTVQAALEEAVEKLTGVRELVSGAGRTDAGVHAHGQVASFTSETTIPIVSVRRGINTYLPPSVAVVAADDVPLDFDPRRHASGKLYRYCIWSSEARSPLELRNTWHVRKPLDVERMQAAAALLVGRHDFTAFRASDCERKTTVRHLRRLDVCRVVGAYGSTITVEAEADAFLKNMVRILVGTLVEVGKGKLSPDELRAVLVSGDRGRAGITAPPQGLALVRVDYDPSRREALRTPFSASADRPTDPVSDPSSRR